MAIYRCEKCNGYVFPDELGSPPGHECPPSWEVIDGDTSDTSVVYADTAKEAAERAASKYHDNWDHPQTVNYGKAYRVLVRPEDGNHAYQRFIVNVTYSPELTAEDAPAEEAA